MIGGSDAIASKLAMAVVNSAQIYLG